MTDQKIENVKYDSFIASKKLVDEYSNFLKKLEKGLASNDKKFVLEEFLNKALPKVHRCNNSRIRYRNHR